MAPNSLRCATLCATGLFLRQLRSAASAPFAHNSASAAAHGRASSWRALCCFDFAVLILADDRSIDRREMAAIIEKLQASVAKAQALQEAAERLVGA